MKRIEVLTPIGWRGPMGALRRLGNAAPPGLRHDLLAVMQCPGVTALRFGQGLFAWTEAGWEAMGLAVLSVLRDYMGPSRVRVIQVAGEVLHLDDMQAIIRYG